METGDPLAALVIGAGPAGLMAAEQLAAAGHRVLLAEAMPSPGRKLLMAGKSGLNLTRAQPHRAFVANYRPPGAAEPLPAALARALDGFGPEAVQDWARGLGQDLFTGSTGRVFPVAMKASPLLRAWLARLSGQGVTLRRRWRWRGFDGTGFRFATPEGPRTLRPRVAVLALGGGSWPRLGSDGGWIAPLAAAGVAIAPLRPANAGLALAWSPHMAPHLGAAVKPVALHAGSQRSRGELVISARGLEGGGLYPLTPLLREGVALTLDLAPDLAPEALARRLGPATGQSLSSRLRRAGLSGARAALAHEFGRPLPVAAPALAARLKALAVPHGGVRPLAEAISSAGGIRWEALGEQLELTALPGVFAAGEMLDWEAPTGGYLLTACLATGRLAGEAAARRLREAPP